MFARSEDVQQFDNVVSLRTAPQVTECEEAVLGGCLLDSKAIERVVDVLPPDAFYHRSHELIYRAMVSLYNQGLTTDLNTVAVRLRDTGHLEKVGGPSTLVRLLENTISSVNVDQYAGLIVKKWNRRKLIKACQEVAQAAYDGSIEDEALEQLTSDKILQSVGVSKASTSMDIDELAGMESERLTAILEGNHQTTAIATGFYDLDGMTKGHKGGELIIVAGRPGMGKSGFALRVAGFVAQSRPAHFFTLEMKKEEQFRRLWSAQAEVESNRISTGIVEGSQLERLGSSLAPLSNLRLRFDDNPSPSIEYIRKQALAYKRQMGDLGIVVIDYLHLMTGDDAENENIELGRITRGAKKLAGELDCPVYLLSQLSRGVESRANKRPMNSDLRQSGCIEQDADLIMMLYRDEYYNDETPDRGIAEVIITKHRNGPCGTIKLLFEPQFSRFRNLATRF